MTKTRFLVSLASVIALAVMLSDAALEPDTNPRENSLMHEVRDPIPPPPGAKEDCYNLSYYGDLTYYWTIPDQYDDDLFNTRFTPDGMRVCTLKTSWIGMYGSAFTGTPAMRVYLWETDGYGFPGARLDSIDIPYEQLPPGLGWVEVDWAGAGKNWVFRFGDEFHVGFTILPSGPGDTLAVVFDDGYGPTCGEERSSIFFDNQFYSTKSFWGGGD
ncbi:MAG: hypothetical protein JSV44_06075, partial [Candidatus Zixiibacteriota bacterium]